MDDVTTINCILEIDYGHFNSKDAIISKGYYFSLCTKKDLI
jgi:hypothetical protein